MPPRIHGTVPFFKRLLRTRCASTLRGRSVDDGACAMMTASNSKVRPSFELRSQRIAVFPLSRVLMTARHVSGSLPSSRWSSNNQRRLSPGRIVPGLKMRSLRTSVGSHWLFPRRAPAPSQHRPRRVYLVQSARSRWVCRDPTETASSTLARAAARTHTVYGWRG